jgi:hypothetical protein
VVIKWSLVVSAEKIQPSFHSGRNPDGYVENLDREWSFLVIQWLFDGHSIVSAGISRVATEVW